MAVITRAYSESDGNIAYASSINKVIDDLYTLNAGNIGTTNLANSGVLNSSIKNSAVNTAKIAHSAITSDLLGPSSVIALKVANSAILNVAVAATANISYEKLGSTSVWVAQRLFLEVF